MSNAFTEQASLPPVLIDRKAIMAANPSIGSAAKWFWWIAALSLINTVLIHSGSDTSFLAGLGFTLVIDSFFQGYPVIAIAVDTLAIGFFFVMGLMALRGHRWAFLLGGVLYAFDALIFIPLQAWLAVAFHGWALFSLWHGGMLLHRTIKAQQAESLVADASLATATPQLLGKD